MHIFNKPNKELISINKCVLIGLRESLAWGLQTTKELEKKGLLEMSDFLLPWTSKALCTRLWFLSNKLRSGVFVSMSYFLHEMAASFPHHPSPPAAMRHVTSGSTLCLWSQTHQSSIPGPDYSMLLLSNLFNPLSLSLL